MMDGAVKDKAPTTASTNGTTGCTTYTSPEPIAAGLRSRAWCWTLNNPTTMEITALRSLLPNPPVRYLTYGEEIGSENTPHLQGYLEATTTLSWSRVMKILGPRTYARPRHAKSTSKACITYCHKDGQVWEIGHPAEQGSRSDLLSLQSDLDQGMSMRDVAVNHFGLFLRSANYIRQYRELVVSVDRTTPRIIWLWGGSGVGKSRCLPDLIAAKLAGSSTPTPDIYELSVTGNTGTWWSGYDGQPVVVMDDVRSEAMRHSMWLRIFDCRPVTVPIYGGAVPLVAKWFFITTNDPPHMFFLSGDGSGAFIRRIRDFATVYQCKRDVIICESTPLVL